MTTRFFAPVAVGVLAVSLSASSCAQNTTDPIESDPSKTQEQAEDDIFGPAAKQEPNPAEEDAPAATDATVTSDADGPAMTAADANNAALELHELRERVAALETELDGLRATLSTLQQGLARIPNADELSNRALGAMAEDLPGTMGELMQGKVRLVNDSRESVVMYVNGTAWTVVPGESYVLAPVGTVSFLYKPDGTPEFKGVQEWKENRETGQYELEYRVTAPGTSASERSVLKPLPGRKQ